MIKRLTILLVGLLSLSLRPAKPASETYRPYYFYTVPNEHYLFLAGEYQAGIIDLTTKTFYNVNSITSSESFLTAGTIIGGAAGPHHICVFDTSGNVFCRGDNSSGALGIGSTANQANFTQILTDSLGNPFNGVTQINASSSAVGWNTFFLKNDSTVWACGALDAGMRGNGTDGSSPVTRPVKINFPAGVKIVKIQCGFSCQAVASNGDVYMWGCNYNYYQAYVLAQCTATPVYNTPTKITLPYPAIDIASNGQTLLALLNQGSLYGWAYEAGSLGVGNPNDGNPQNPSGNWAALCPGLLDTANTAQSFPGAGRTIKKIFSGSENNFALLSDSTIWVQGDNANGGAGDGVMMDWRNYSGANGRAPWNWDQSYGQKLYRKWRQMAVGKHNWVDVFTGPALVYYAVFEDADGKLYWCGRNKGGVIPNNIGGVDSIGGELESVYPNNKNGPFLTQFYPWKTYPHIIRVTSQLFLDSAGQYSSTYPLNTSGSAPTATTNYSTVTIAQGATVTLIAAPSYTSPATGIFQSWWTHDAGGSYYLPIPGGDTAQFTGLSRGVHVLTYRAKDSQFKSITKSVTVIVSCASCQIRPHGGKHKKLNA